MWILLQSILWSFFGAVLGREWIVEDKTTKYLGGYLFWVGVPLQIFYLARNSNFKEISLLPVAVTIAALIIGIVLVNLFLTTLRKWFLDKGIGTIPNRRSKDKLVIETLTSLVNRITTYEKLSLPLHNSESGSFMLSSILGNTGFIGLALVPSLVDRNFWGWIVIYGVVHNILGSYGIGVVIANHYSYFGKRQKWSEKLQRIFLLPSLWAFAYGYMGKNLILPSLLEKIIDIGVLTVVPGAFILIGMRLAQLKGIENVKSGVFPTIFKLIILPGLIGLGLTGLGYDGDARLVLVLMSGMPTAFASLILAEAYSLDSNTSATSVLLSTLFLPATVCLWLTIF